MSKYTTGELAKLCGVTVRTVQYYDTRGILSPSELSEGGRRLYTDDDLRQLRIICFLRDMGLPIDAIGQLLAEEEPGRVIQLLLEQQELEVRRQLVLWIVTSVWWPCAVYLLLSVPFGILISRYYFRRVAYLCPQCHTVFRPALKEAFFARHTPSARKLTCGCCGYHGFCVETLGGDGV